jgi:hypothetical protein
MIGMDRHFHNCHPDDDTDPRPAPDPLPAPGTADACWHCGTQTPHGCSCVNCLANADVIPPSAIWHCPLCGRWWAYMTPVITKITFGDPE